MPTDKIEKSINVASLHSPWWSGPENLSSSNFSRVYSQLANITVMTAGKTLKLKMKHYCLHISDWNQSTCSYIHKWNQSVAVIKICSCLRF